MIKIYKRELPSMKESLDIICSPSKDKKGTYAEFGYIFYAVSYFNPKRKSSKSKEVNNCLDYVLKK